MFNQPYFDKKYFKKEIENFLNVTFVALSLALLSTTDVTFVAIILANNPARGDGFTNTTAANLGQAVGARVNLTQGADVDCPYDVSSISHSGARATWSPQSELFGLTQRMEARYV